MDTKTALKKNVEILIVYGAIALVIPFALWAYGVLTNNQLFGIYSYEVIAALAVTATWGLAKHLKSKASK